MERLVVVPMASGVRALSPLETEIIRFLNRFVIARGFHIAAWTGASAFTISSGMTALAKTGLVVRREVPADLRGPSGRIERRRCYVWELTNAGASAAGEWRVPGSKGRVLGMTRSRSSDAMVGHALGCVDLAVWYRVHGFDVAAEREIVSLEKESKIAPDRLISSDWSVIPTGRIGIHPPDLGALAPDGSKWAIELERAEKTVGEYAAVIAAYRNAGLGQVWHVLQKATQQRLRRAAEQVGAQWAPDDDGAKAWVSTDGRLRIVSWRPGLVGPIQPKDWTAQVSRQTAPGGFPVRLPLPDLSSSWRRGSVRDPNADDFDPDDSGRLVRFTLPADDQDELA
jgi:hypothetical protein